MMTSPSGAADPVHVGFGIVGNIVIHHEADFFNIQAARGDIRRHQHLESSAPQPIDDPFTSLLWNVTVQSFTRQATGGQFFSEFHSGIFSAHKDQYGLESLHFENPSQCVQFVTPLTSQ